MNFKELLKKMKKDKKGGGAKVVNPVNILSGEVIIDQFSFHTTKYEGDPFAEFGTSTIGTFDPSITMVNLIINDVEYFDIPVTKYIEDDEVDFIINFDSETEMPDFNVAPLGIYIVEVFDDPESNYIGFATEEEMDVVLTMKRASGKRIMKLHGASRTYSHTAEPRNVKFAGGVKDWPIKKETTILVDGSFDCGADDSVILVEWTGTQEDFVNQALSVTIDGSEAEKTEWGFQIEGFAEIYYDSGYIQLYAYDAGSFLIKIITGTIEVAEDFKEAVEMVGSGGSSDPYMPSLPDPTDPEAVIEYPVLYAVGGHGEYDSYGWKKSIPPQIMPGNINPLTMLVPAKNSGDVIDWTYIDLTDAKGFNQDNAKFILQGSIHTLDIPTNLRLSYDPSPTIPPIYGADADGTYMLKATKSGATITYEWVKE